MNANFKDQLIKNRWLVCQDKLSLSLINEYDIDLIDFNTSREKLYNNNNFKEWRDVFNNFHTKYRFFDKYFNCPQYHCMKSSYQYHKLSDSTRKSDYRQKTIKLKYDHFKNRKLTKNSLIKEHLWYNLKNEDSIIISGDYTIDDNNKYIPNKQNSLKLNDIPVSYIEISQKNKDIVNMKCNLLYFCFDMSSYCDIIDCILIMSKKKNKTNYFSYLPLEIIKYILLLNSIN
jgi:hypothetical protein